MTKLFNISPLLLLLGGCSLGMEPPPVDGRVEPPHHGPPLSAGRVCVDVDQAEAQVVVNGAVATERCVDTVQSYGPSVVVEVTKPGFQTETQEVSLLRSSPIELDIRMRPVDLPI